VAVVLASGRPKAVTLRKLSLLFLLSALLAACTPSKDRPIVELDFNTAKAMSDAVLDDLIKADSKDLMERLDVGFHSLVKDEKDLKLVLEKMYKQYGKPLSGELKVSQAGVRMDDQWRRPKRTFWYAVKTTKYPKNYFLKVEVVRAFSSDNLDVAGFGFLTFNDPSKAPSYMH